jgi:hypothetical protein
MDRGRVGEDRGSKEIDGCPLTESVIPPFLLLLSNGLLALGPQFTLSYYSSYIASSQ